MAPVRRMEPIKTESVTDKVVNALTNAIADGRFKLGEKLPSEFELMEELGVSRNSLREAIKILSALGIVEIRRGEGTYICSHIKPTALDSIVYGILLENSSGDEILELRKILDEDVLMLAMHKCTEENYKQLREYIQQMHDAFAVGDVHTAAEADYNFHIYLAHCTKNALLIRIVEGVYSFFASSIEKNIATEELFGQAAAHHQEILDCLLSKAESKVPEIIGHSLSSWQQNLIEKMH